MGQNDIYIAPLFVAVLWKFLHFLLHFITKVNKSLHFIDIIAKKTCKMNKNVVF